MHKKDIVVFGVGGFGREIIEELSQKNSLTGEYNILGFVDDNIAVQGQIINGYKVIGTSEILLNRKDEVSVLVCVGENSIRKIVVNKLRANENIKFPNFIARNVILNENLVSVGMGNIIYSNSMLSVNIKIGDFNYINSSVSISHDVKIGNFTTISPCATITGSVTINDDSYIGAGTVIRESVTIGENTIIGMGSVVVKDISNNKLAFGNPCKEQRDKEKNERVFK